VAKLGRWVAKLVARLLATAAHWVRIQTSLKVSNAGDISKGKANTLYPAKIQKKTIIFVKVKNIFIKLSFYPAHQLFFSINLLPQNHAIKQHLQ
jgi:hypothetical protein